MIRNRRWYVIADDAITVLIYIFSHSFLYVFVNKECISDLDLVFINIKTNISYYTEAFDWVCSSIFSSREPPLEGALATSKVTSSFWLWFELKKPKEKIFVVVNLNETENDFGSKMIENDNFLFGYEIADNAIT